MNDQQINNNLRYKWTISNQTNKHSSKIEIKNQLPSNLILMIIYRQQKNAFEKDFWKKRL